MADRLQSEVAAAALDAQDADPPSRVSCTIDFEAEGRQAGLMTVPHSRNDSAWGSIQVPITQVRNGHGPTILLTAGSHGDEYEGPIALMKLARRLDPARVAGRILILPTMNLPAVRAGTRLSPIDGRNMNRVFPGDRNGTITEIMADFVCRRLVGLSDIVVDLHSGGKTLDFLPCAVMHFLDDPDLMARTFAAVQAFCAPAALLLRELDNQGMLDTVVEEQGRVFVSTELGGSGSATARSVAIAERGVHNLLCHFGILDEKPVKPGHETRVLATPDGRSYTIASDTGMLEMCADLGEEVAEGETIGRIYDYEDPEARVRDYVAHRSGVLVARHAPGLVQRGDCLAVIAEDVERDLLPRIDREG